MGSDFTKQACENLAFIGEVLKARNIKKPFLSQGFSANWSKPTSSWFLGSVI